MPISFTKKRFLARAKRHQNECYGTVISPCARQIAWLQVDGQRERLLCRSVSEGPCVALTRKTYVLSPHFAGDMLLWS
jgi:hypothetical protein